MKKLLMLAATLGMLLAATPAMAQSGADGGFNCRDFGSQQEAQDFYNADPSDPEGLDDDDGQACEDFDYGDAPTTPVIPDDDDDDENEEVPVTPQYTEYGDEGNEEILETVTSLPVVEEPSVAYSTLPDTGGPSVLLPVSALLIGAGMLGYAVIRKR